MKHLKSSLAIAACALALLNSFASAQNTAARRTAKQTSAPIAQPVLYGTDSPRPSSSSPSLKMMVDNLNSLSVKGATDAPVTIIEFSDLECPFCRRAAATMREVVAAYPSKIRLIHQKPQQHEHRHDFERRRRPQH